MWGNETHSLNTAGDASPVQTQSAHTSEREARMKLPQGLMRTHRETVNSEAPGSDFFSQIFNQVELYPSRTEQEKSHVEKN